MKLPLWKVGKDLWALLHSGVIYSPNRLHSPLQSWPATFRLVVVLAVFAESTIVVPFDTRGKGSGVSCVLHEETKKIKTAKWK